MAYKNTKTEHAFQRFHKDLKEGQFPNVIFMFGEEEYLIQWACNSLADKLIDKTMMDMDFVKIGETISVDELLSICDTFSIFSEHRIVWAKNYPPLIKKNNKGFENSQIEELIAYLENPNSQTILIFSCAEPDESGPLVKALKKNHKTYEFSRLDRPQLNGFAEKRFKSAGIEIDRSTLKYLIDETGYFNRETDYSIFNLDNDIKKLIAYCDDGRITEEDIDTTLKGDLDKFAFDFLDAVTNNRKDVALRILNNILGAGIEFYSVLGLLVNQFELILEIKEVSEDISDSTKIAEVLKMNQYRVKKAKAFSDKYSLKKIKTILIQLYEIDRSIKMGLMEQNLALELLIGRM